MILALAIACGLNCTTVEKSPPDPGAAKCISERAAIAAAYDKQQDIIADLLKRLEAKEQPVIEPVAEKKKPRKRVCYRGRVLNSKNQCVRKR